MMNLFVSDALAQAAGAPAAGPSTLMSFLPMIAIFFIFYFLMIRPQKKRIEEERKFLDSIQKGDEVYTKSGLLGTIVGLTDKVVTLELSEGVRVKYLRSQIAGASKEILAPSTKEAAKAGQKA